MTNSTATVRVLIPLALREHTGGIEEIGAEGATIGAVIDSVLTEHPSMRRQIFDDSGALRGYVNIYLNEDELRTLSNGSHTPLQPGDTIMIVPSIAGG
jgi:molybdopterin converting factor small subunit